VERKQAFASRFASLLRLFKWQNHLPLCLRSNIAIPRKKGLQFRRQRLDDIPSLFRQANRASMLLGLAEYKTEDAIWISTYIAPSKTRQSLVEFLGVLLPSFQPTLQAL
jgi:hypothetical protein